MTVEELRQSPGHEHWITLSHEEILPFVQKEFGRKDWLLGSYLLLNLALLLFMVVLGGWQASQGWVSVGKMILNSILGFTLALSLLIPVHEAIHGLAYKFVGAPAVQYGSDIRKFIFYAMADHFVIGFPQFVIVALAPFLVINFFTTLGLFYVSLNYQWVLLGVLLMHTGACAGDFAMLNFFLRHRSEGVLTYDDVENKVSYFYREKNNTLSAPAEYQNGEV